MFLFLSSITHFSSSPSLRVSLLRVRCVHSFGLRSASLYTAKYVLLAFSRLAIQSQSIGDSVCNVLLLRRAVLGGSGTHSIQDMHRIRMDCQ